jgi:hypothetical protein
LKSILNKIKRWYNGSPIVIDISSEKKGNVVFLGVPFSAGTQYHWSAKVVRVLVNFHRKHWKWIWPFLTTVIFGVISLVFPGTE